MTEKKKDLFILQCFSVSVSLLMMKNTIITGSQLLHNYNSTLNLIIMGISVVLYIYAIIIKDQGRLYFNSKQLFLIVGIFLFWGGTYVINSTVFTYSYAKEEMVYFIINCLPALLILPTMTSAESVLLQFYKLRWIMFIVSTITVLLMIRSGSIQGSGTRAAEYSMSFGRALILPTLLFISYWNKNDSKKDLLAAGILSVYILLFGSRFPLLCIISFFIWKYIEKDGARKKIETTIGIGIIAVVFLVSGNEIIAFVSSKLQKVGINSRALTLLQSGKFGYADTRIEIYEKMLPIINKSPIIGYGAFGGNYITNNGLSHSYFLDLFANLGYLCGGIFLFVVTFSIVRLYKHSKDFYNHEFILICICQFLPISLISLSLWRATWFWYLIAMCVGRISNTNEECVKDESGYKKNI